MNAISKTMAVTVAVDTNELRHWAAKHADAGHHGVAHVLYKAAANGESLTEQAITAAARDERNRLLDHLTSEQVVTALATHLLQEYVSEHNDPHVTCSDFEPEAIDTITALRDALRGEADG